MRKYLVAHGIAPQRLESEGFGSSRPIFPNDTKEGRARNRRVEMIIVRRASTVPPTSAPDAVAAAQQG